MYELTEYLARIEKKAHQAVRAVIRESECIGCVKCVRACPVDAIVGAAKQIHTVITVECTGCELCVEPCPVDCIDIVSVPTPSYDLSKVSARFKARKKRLSESTKSLEKLTAIESIADKQAYIAAALTRVKIKRELISRAASE